MKFFKKHDPKVEKEVFCFTNKESFDKFLEYCKANFTEVSNILKGQEKSWETGSKYVKYFPERYFCLYKSKSLKCRVIETDECFYLDKDTLIEKSDSDPKTAIGLMNKVFKELNGDKGLSYAFKQYHDNDIRRCIQSPIYYSAPIYGRVVNKANKIDFSSMYGFAASGKLPSAYDIRICEGQVEPDEFYQFAFYIKSGHMAIYNELDTRTYDRNDKFYNKCFCKNLDPAKNFDDRMKPDLEPSSDITVLMKVAKYTLAETINKFYENKEAAIDKVERLKWKDAINKVFGQFHRKKYDRDCYGHLAAVIKARANKMMLDLLHNQLSNCLILQVIVDGVVYVGNKVGNKEKKLGNIILEVEEADYMARATNVYMLRKNDICEFVVHSGYNAYTDENGEIHYLERFTNDEHPEMKFDDLYNLILEEQ